MPHHKAAYKSIRKDKKRGLRNKNVKSELRTVVKKLEVLIGQKDASAKDLLRTIIAKLNKAASKGIIHKNNARRRISRLTKKLAKLTVSK